VRFPSVPCFPFKKWVGDALRGERL
jgi:hypothetical protein